MKHFGFFSAREYEITARSKDFQFSQGFTDYVVAHSLREAWKLFKIRNPHHIWIFQSAKSDTGYFTKIN